MRDSRRDDLIMHNKSAAFDGTVPCSRLTLLVADILGGRILHNGRLWGGRHNIFMTHVATATGPGPTVYFTTLPHAHKHYTCIMVIGDHSNSLSGRAILCS